MKLSKSKSSSEKISKPNPTPGLKQKENEKSVKMKRTVFFLVLFALIFSLSAYLILNKSDGSPISLSFFAPTKNKQQVATDPTPDPQASTAPSPSPKPLPTGSQTYNYSHGKDVVGPKPTKVTIDPIDPSIGKEITVTVDISHDSDVTSAQVEIITDNSSLSEKLKLKSGDKQSGTWQAKIKIKDTYDYNYYIKFDLQSSTGNYSGGLKIR